MTPSKVERPSYTGLTTKTGVILNPGFSRVKDLARSVRDFRVTSASPELAYPAWLAHVFVIQAAQPCGHDPWPSQITHYTPRIFTINYRQAADIIAQHLGCGIMQGFVRIGHDHFAASRFKQIHGTGRILFKRTQDICTRNDSGQPAFRVQKQHALMATCLPVRDG